jgi:hypothetical protein
LFLKDSLINEYLFYLKYHFINGVMDVNIFCLFVFNEFNDASKLFLKDNLIKQYLYYLKYHFFINGVMDVNIFCLFVFNEFNDASTLFLIA